MSGVSICMGSTWPAGASIVQGFGGANEGAEPEAPDAGPDEDDEGETTADATILGAELVSWAVAVAFGRFDVRLATGARTLPGRARAVRSVASLLAGYADGDDGMPLASAPAGYPIAFPDNGILRRRPGHPRDLTAAVRAVFETVFGPRADAWWDEVAALLDPNNHDLRAWLASSFFEHHLKRHSKSRRKAPILWQLGTPSGRYSVVALCPPADARQLLPAPERHGGAQARPRGAPAH